MNYDDDRYVEHSNRLIANVESGIEGLREAGLSDDEIKGELKNALDNAGLDAVIT